ncbi:MAG TPA: glycosyltransferase [Gaiellaceae bacterium]|nr:glycosyltransferase [Gaiellaceae bacterium]
MRILVVLTQPPLPEGGAAGKTALGLLRGLAGHGIDLRAIAAQRHFAVAGEVPADLPVEITPVAPPSSWRGRVDRYRRPRSELAGRFADRVRELARDAEVLHLEETETAWCDRGLATPSVLHVHYLVRRDRDLGAPWRRGFRDVLEQRRAERIALRTHRHLVASSPVVAEALGRDAPGAEVVLAPLTVDPSVYPPAALDGPPVAGIIGTAAWPPTAEAMRELVHTVWPLVRRRVPKSQLIIAGRGTDALGLAGPGVEVRGEVESAGAFLRDLSVLLFPQRRGSGMKVKVLEAIASGVPVVTTAAGAEGIAPNDGVTVSEEPQVLADAAAELLADPAARRERGAAALAAFAAAYAPGPATRPLAELYSRLA